GGVGAGVESRDARRRPESLSRPASWLARVCDRVVSGADATLRRAPGHGAVASRVRSLHHDTCARASRVSARLARGGAARPRPAPPLPARRARLVVAHEDARRPANTHGWPLFLRHHAAPGRYPVTGMRLTDRWTDGVRTALAKAALPEPDACAWEVPRQAEHGDYATNAPMVLARVAKRAPRQIADLVVKHFPSMPEVERLEAAGRGFLNVFLAPAWCTAALTEILGAGGAVG